MSKSCLIFAFILGCICGSLPRLDASFPPPPTVYHQETECLLKQVRTVECFLPTDDEEPQHSHEVKVLIR